MNGVVEAPIKIRELIAKAVTSADRQRCPDCYADDAGFGDHDWLSDWAAFVADKVALALEEAGCSLSPLVECGCGKRFKSNKQLKRHRLKTSHVGVRAS